MLDVLKNIPNSLTISRIILAPIFFILFIYDYRHAALICFFIASITDALDGFLARRFNVVSKFGRLYDPLADKILLFLGFICIVIEPPFIFAPMISSGPSITLYFSYVLNLQPNTVIYLILAVLLFRDFIVTTLREVKLRKDNIILKTNFMAKIKTIMLIISIHFYLLYQLLGGVEVIFPKRYAQYSIEAIPYGPCWSMLWSFDFFLYLTLILSLLSLINYINQYRSKGS